MSPYSQSSVLTSSATSTPVQKDYNTLVENLYTCLNEHLIILINQMLKTAGDRLFRLSEKASSNKKQMLYLDTIQFLNKHQSTIKNQFFVTLNQSLGANNETPVTSSSNDELSLVGQDEMEEMVAITTMHSQAMNRFSDEINHLQARLEYLEINAVDVFDKTSIEPKSLCEIYSRTLIDMDQSIETKLILFRLYNDSINSKLGVLYKALNKLFIDAGVLPEIVLKTSKDDVFFDDEEDTENTPKVVRKSGEVYNENINQHQQKDYHGGSASTEHNASAFSSASNHSDNDESCNNQTAAGLFKNSQDSFVNNPLYNKTSQVITQFLNGDAVIQGPGIPDSFSRLASQTAADGKHYYKRNEVMLALSRLQHNLMQETTATSDNTDGEIPQRTINTQLIDAESIKRELLADIGTQNGGIVDKQVNVLDERSIDFVGMMFNAITSDESISKVISSLIMRLQIPVIKVAMLDQSLFTHENHPARHVLNLVTDAGKGITSEADRVYGELELIVNHIIDTFDIDMAVFEEAVESLQQLISNEEKLVKETERAEQRAIIKAHAREVVVGKLKILSSRKKLPRKIRPLVLKHWSTLMLNQYIKKGKDSIEWLQSVLLLKLLLKCVQPVNEKTQYMLLKNNHQALIEAVNDELSQTDQEQKEVNHQITLLDHIFKNMIDDYDFKIIQEKDQQLSSVADESSLDNVLSFVDKTSDSAGNQHNDNEDKIFIEIKDNDEALDSEAQTVQEKINLAKDKIAQLGNQARPGDWYEIYNGEGRAVRRLKLSVILTESARLIFVDRRGVKVIEKDASQFIEELNDGRSKLIADHSAFDFALGKVIHSLAA